MDADALSRENAYKFLQDYPVPANSGP